MASGDGRNPVPPKPNYRKPRPYGRENIRNAMKWNGSFAASGASATSFPGSTDAAATQIAQINEWADRERRLERAEDERREQRFE